jgi:hypothetical protein
MSSEEETKVLLKIRDNLERRIETLEQEINDLKTALTIIDENIIKEGFKKPRPPENTNNENISQEEDETSILGSVKGKDGTTLGILTLEGDKLIFTPQEDFGFKLDIPPLQSFFLDKVLENMRSADEQGVIRGELEPEEVLSYEINSTDDQIETIIISNYGGERRLRDIRSSLRWTFDKMYDKIRQG